MYVCMYVCMYCSHFDFLLEYNYVMLKQVRNPEMTLCGFRGYKHPITHEHTNYLFILLKVYSPVNRTGSYLRD